MQVSIKLCTLSLPRMFTKIGTVLRVQDEEDRIMIPITHAEKKELN